MRLACWLSRANVPSGLGSDDRAASAKLRSGSAAANSPQSFHPSAAERHAADEIRYVDGRISRSHRHGAGQVEAPPDKAGVMPDYPEDLDRAKLVRRRSPPVSILRVISTLEAKARAEADCDAPIANGQKDEVKLNFV
jgi:hypothetical protein